MPYLQPKRVSGILDEPNRYVPVLFVHGQQIVCQTEHTSGSNLDLQDCHEIVKLHLIRSLCQIPNIPLLLGGFSSGPLYAAFPIAGMFIKKGVSLTNVFLFLGAWSTTKIPMMLFEAAQLGSKFAGIRFALNVMGTVILAVIIEKTTASQEQENLYQNIGTILES